MWESHCHSADKMWSGLGTGSSFQPPHRGTQSVNGTWFTAQVEFLITLPRGKVGQKLAVALMRINAYLATSIWLDDDGFAASLKANLNPLKALAFFATSFQLYFFASLFAGFSFFFFSFLCFPKLAKFLARAFAPRSVAHAHTYLYLYIIQQEARATRHTNVAKSKSRCTPSILKALVHCTIELLHRVEQTFAHLVLDLVT